MTVAALIVSIVAAVISCLMAWFTWRNVGAAEASAEAAKQSAEAAQNTARIEVERRAEEVQDRADAERAARSARVLVMGGGHDRGVYDVVVQNDGPADATDVTVALDPQPNRHPSDGQQFQRIAGGYSESFRVSLSDQMPLEYDVTVTWTDGNGQHTDTSHLHL